MAEGRWAFTLLPAAPSYQVAADTLHVALSLPVKLFVLRAQEACCTSFCATDLTCAHREPALALEPVRLDSLPRAAMPRAPGLPPVETPYEGVVVALEVQLRQGAKLLAVQHVGVPLCLLMGDRAELELDLQLTVPPQNATPHDLPCVLTCQVLPGCVEESNVPSRVIAQCKLPIMPASPSTPQAPGPAHELCNLYTSMLAQYQELADAESLLSSQDGGDSSAMNHCPRGVAPGEVAAARQRELILQHLQVWLTCFEPVLCSIEQLLDGACTWDLWSGSSTCGATGHTMQPTQLVQYLYDQGLTETASCLLLRLGRVQPAPPLPPPPHAAVAMAPAQDTDLADLGHGDDGDDWAVFSISEENCGMLLQALRSAEYGRSTAGHAVGGPDLRHATAPQQTQHIQDLDNTAEDAHSTAQHAVFTSHRLSLEAPSSRQARCSAHDEHDDFEVGGAVAGSEAWAASVSMVPVFTVPDAAASARALARQGKTYSARLPRFGPGSSAAQSAPWAHVKPGPSTAPAALATHVARAMCGVTAHTSAATPAPFVSYARADSLPNLPTPGPMPPVHLEGCLTHGPWDGVGERANGSLSSVATAAGDGRVAGLSFTGGVGEALRAAMRGS